MPVFRLEREDFSISPSPGKTSFTFNWSDPSHSLSYTGIEEWDFPSWVRPKHDSSSQVEHIYLWVPPVPLTSKGHLLRKREKRKGPSGIQSTKEMLLRSRG